MILIHRMPILSVLRPPMMIVLLGVRGSVHILSITVRPSSPTSSSPGVAPPPSPPALAFIELTVALLRARTIR